MQDGTVNAANKLAGRTGLAECSGNINTCSIDVEWPQSWPDYANVRLANRSVLPLRMSALAAKELPWLPTTAGD